MENMMENTMQSRPPLDAEKSQQAFSRRTVLAFAGSLGAVTSLGAFGVARAFTSDMGALPQALDNFPICHTAAAGEAAAGSPRQLKLAWNATAICTASAPVAKERGIFAKRNLDVDFVNFGGSTEQLLEANCDRQGRRRHRHGAPLVEAARTGLRRSHYRGHSRRMPAFARRQIGRD